MATKLGPLDTEAVVEAAEAAGLEGDDLRRDYSGRGMFGDRCFGIVGGPREFAAFIAEVTMAESDGRATEGLAGRLAENVVTDGMGLSTIYYFPAYLLDGGLDS